MIVTRDVKMVLIEYLLCATQKLAHAYLFCGPRGVGKTTCARIFAKTINCMTPTADGEACNQCESCVAFNEQRSYNIHELDAASNNSVDDIRQLVEQVRIPPQIGKYKVYIIDEVHMLSASAFNAFLKTLEEPPRHAIFILATTEKHKILPTILSRCQIYDFNRISVEDTVNHLSYVASKEGISAEPEALNAVLEAVRQMALMKNGGEENDLHLRTLEVAQIREDEYFGSLIADDLKGILRDIRNEHRPDTMTADETTLVATVQGQLQDAMNFEGSSKEKQVRALMATIGLDYDTLTKEEFVSIISGLKKSKYLKSPINQRGKARPQLPHGKGKKKRK